MTKKKRPEGDQVEASKPDSHEPSPVAVESQIESATKKRQKPEGLEELTQARLLRLAETHPPAQSWYEEDMEGLY